MSIYQNIKGICKDMIPIEDKVKGHLDNELADIERYLRDSAEQLIDLANVLAKE